MTLGELLAANPHLDMPVEALEPGDIIAEAVFIMRVVQLEDEASSSDQIVVSATHGCGGVIQYGLVCTAKFQLETWMQRGPE